MANKMIYNLKDGFDDFGLIGILATLIILGVIFIIAITVYKEISFGEYYGKIVNKRYSPSYYSRSDNTSQYHGASYQFQLEKDGKRLWINVSASEYDNLTIGDCYNKCEE